MYLARFILKGGGASGAPSSRGPTLVKSRTLTVEITSRNRKSLVEIGNHSRNRKSLVEIGNHSRNQKSVVEIRNHE